MCLHVLLPSVWKEWVIVNNTFQAMLFANGDMCPGEKPRQTKVYTALACPIDENQWLVKSIKIIWLVSEIDEIQRLKELWLSIFIDYIGYHQ